MTKKAPLARYPLLLIYRLIGLVFRQDARITKRLPDYFPTYRSFAGELLNQVLRCAGSARSYRPQGIVIEPTNCCNLACRHCTARSNDEKRGYMEFGFYKRILDENPGITCLMLSRFGEPFLHRDLFDMIAYAKSKGIYVFLYTNGALLDRDRADRILSSGLDEINFSLEGIGADYEKNRNVPYRALKETMEYLIAERDRRGAPLKIGINVATIEGDERAADEIRREWGARVDHIDVEPLIGAEAPRRKRSCRTLWRNAVIRWDGVVFPCCIDMKGSLALGDLNRSTLRDIFNGPRAAALRKSHLAKKFPAVCAGCDTLFG